MRFEPRHAFVAARSLQRRPDLPPDLAFLPAFGIAPGLLATAARRAKGQNVTAADLLIAEGGLSARTYYDCLARHLGVPFVAGWPDILPIEDPVAAHRCGRIALAGGGSAQWLVAPEGNTLTALLGAKRCASIALTTPAHLAAIIHHAAQRAIEHAASEALPIHAPNLSARGIAGAKVLLVVVAVLVCGTAAYFVAHRLLLDLLGFLFLSGMILRAMVSAFGLTQVERDVPRVSDAVLPVYSVLVPLSRESAVVPEILAALDAIDYPRAKLQVLLLIEPEDRATRAALAASPLPPWLHVVLGPVGGSLRTKPRALNVGLLMARGEFVTVFDAEDRPDADQLRRAVARFRGAPPSVACLQAKLAIEDGDCSCLARLFATEYAALFDVWNVGLSALDLPFPLGGTSNHFRTAALRAAGGWDAWNVTEDADLGLRLARLGYAAECLDSTTAETAPATLPIWFKQRRRWTKGWMQTLIVVARDAGNLRRRLGTFRAAMMSLTLFNLVLGPLLFPVFSILVAIDLVRFGLPAPRGIVEIGEATLGGFVFVFGLATIVWCGYAGLRVRGLSRFLPSLPLLIPYQVLISAAAWMGLLDLIVRPHHWHKTTHRPRTPR